MPASDSPPDYSTALDAQRAAVKAKLRNLRPGAEQERLRSLYSALCAIDAYSAAYVRANADANELPSQLRGQNRRDSIRVLEASIARDKSIQAELEREVSRHSHSDSAMSRSLARAKRLTKEAEERKINIGRNMNDRQIVFPNEDFVENVKELLRGLATRINEKIIESIREARRLGTPPPSYTGPTRSAPSAPPNYQTPAPAAASTVPTDLDPALRTFLSYWERQQTSHQSSLRKNHFHPVSRRLVRL